MNIQTVKQNLLRTIEGKERLREQYINNDEASLVNSTICQMLKINIDELKKILADVDACLPNAVEQSWRDNPDRSGGQFTQDEIYNSSRDGWIEP